MKSEKFIKLRWLFSDLPGNCDLTILFCNFPQTGQVENHSTQLHICCKSSENPIPNLLGHLLVLKKGLT